MFCIFLLFVVGRVVARLYHVSISISVQPSCVDHDKIEPLWPLTHSLPRIGVLNSTTMSTPHSKPWKVFYYILGTHAPPRVIQIDPNRYVAYLVREIRRASGTRGDFCVELFKVDRKVFDNEPNEIEEEASKLLKDSKPGSLRTVYSVEEAFGGCEGEAYVVVRARRGLIARLNEEVSKLSEKQKAIYDLRETVASVARSRLSPSTSARLSTSRWNQQNTEPDAIYNGRPIDLLQPPIALWHPVFSKFRRLMSIPAETLEFSHGELDRARRFVVASSENYDDDHERCSQLSDNSPFARSGCFAERWMLDGEVTSDGGTSTSVNVPYAESVEVFSCFVEVRNEVGVGSLDPMMQAQCTYRAMCSSRQFKPIRMRSCCPCFLVAIAGAHIFVSGAVFSDRLVCEPLLDGSILLGPHFSSGTTDWGVSVGIQRIAHLVSTLEECISDVENHYQGLDLQLYSPVDQSPWAPHFRHFTTRKTRNVTLEYIERIPQEDTEKALFKAFATPETSSSSIVVVKFTAKYNADAHVRLAELGLAPRVWFCERVESVGGWYVVVMDYVESREVDAIGEYPGAVQALRRAVRVLHDEDLVFGDLREPNVLVTEDGASAMLVDFDWCGKVGEARYPNDINLDGISWHADVCLGGKMEKEHDRWCFRAMTGEEIESETSS
ncbi:hypothetical protein BDY19DRAFT_119915 [Irpex rosettiformis]|uniref:Uncharacterized protein n=1 Tax=Irpex rosettiformis TaxID=378272 RepID=A0ACB8U6V7_9APHY|nr:hypothetical protein BDY19DRAFT_119915 [Irpex rosettiformis]